MATVVAAAPVASDATTVCDQSGWYHGYQGVGVQYKVGDTNPAGIIVIGGSVPSGCSTLQPSLTFIGDKCALIEQFSSSTALIPQSYLINSITQSNGSVLGVEGVLALKVSYDKSGSETSAKPVSMFGVLQLGSVQSYTSESTGLPATTDGSELVFFTLIQGTATQSTLTTFWIPSMFKGFNCNLNSQTVDYLGLTNLAFATFSNCVSPWESYILVFNPSTKLITSLTSFSAASVSQWYAMRGNKYGDNDALFAGFINSYPQYDATSNLVGNFPAIVWLATQNDKSSTTASIPKCESRLIMDTKWVAQFGSNSFKPAAVASSPYGSKLSVIGLHSSSSPYGSVIIVSSQLGGLCNPTFDVGEFNNAGRTLQLKLLQMQMYYTTDSTVKMLVQDQVSRKIYLMDNLVVYDSPTNRLVGITSQSIAWQVLSFNTGVFTLGQSSMTTFILPHASKGPIGLGSSSLYFTGVTDGFMLRDQGFSTCLYYNYTSSTISVNVQLDFFSQTNLNLNSALPTGVSQQVVFSSGSVGQTVYQVISNPAFDIWTKASQFQVINPCLLTSSSPYSYVNYIYLYQAQYNFQFSPYSLTNSHKCPFTDSSAYNYNVDLTPVLDPSFASLNYTLAPPITQPYTSTYTPLNVTDVTLIGSYTYTVKQGFYGDLAPSSLNTRSHYIYIKYCYFWQVSSSSISSETYIYLIGNGTQTFSWLSFKGSCNYSTSPTPTSFWDSISVYRKEVITYVGWTVETTNPWQLLSITDAQQTHAGLQTYTVQYTQWDNTVLTINQGFNFCYLNTSGLNNGPYQLTLGETTALNIDLSALTFSSCNYSLSLTYISTQNITSYVTLTQPQMTTTSAAILFTQTSPATLQVSAPGFSLKSYIGAYTLLMNVTDDKNRVAGVQQFTFNIVDCLTVWQPAQATTIVQNYVLGSGLTISIPIFVLTYCNDVVTTFTTNSSFPTAGSLYQQSLSDGTSQLSLSTAITSSTWSLIGTHALTFQCEDTYTSVLSPVYSIQLLVEPRCYTVWPTSLNIPDQSYKIGSIVSITLPGFTSTICNRLVTSLTIVSNTMTPYMTFTQTDQNYGSTTLTLYGTTINQRTLIGAYQVTLTCTDTISNTSMQTQFSLVVLPSCTNQWLPSLSLQNQIQTQGTSLQINTGPFTTISCNPVVTSLTIQPSLTATAISLQQLDLYYGNLLIIVNSTQRNLVGNYTIFLTCYDSIDSFTSYANFQLQILPLCTTEWVSPYTLDPKTYVLGNPVTTYQIFQFATVPCDLIVTNYTIVTGNLNLAGALNFTQQDQLLGNSSFSIQSFDYSLRGNYSLIVYAFDATTNYQLNLPMAFSVYDRCDFQLIQATPIKSQVFFQEGNSTFVMSWFGFGQSLTGCGSFTYSVSVLTSGQLTQDDFTTDTKALQISYKPTTSLKRESVAQIKITGTIESLGWLPSKSISFELKVLPQRLTFNSSVANSTSVNNLENGNPLTCAIQSISVSGLVTIKFSSTLVIPKKYIDLSQNRRISNYSDNFDQVVRISVISGQQAFDLNRTMIVSFNLTDFKQLYIQVQVNFLNPESLSQTNLQVDTLQIVFLENLLFVNTQVQYLAEGTTMKIKIPHQMTQSDAAKLQTLESGVSSSMNVVATVNLFIGLIFSFGLKYMWNFVNILQFLVFMTSWNINYPLNALAVLKYLKSIALMEFIPTQQISSKMCTWFNLDPSDSGNLVNSMGLMLLIGIGLAVVVVAILISSYLVTANYSWYKRYRDIKSQIFYNAFIRYLIQSCLKLGIAAGTTLTAINFTVGRSAPQKARKLAAAESSSTLSFSQICSITMACTILAIIFLSPIFFGLVLKRNFKNLPRPSTQGKIGSLYLSIKNNNNWALAYSPLFLVRRILFLSLTIGLASFSSLQIHFFIFISLMYTIYLGLVIPHDIGLMTTSELLNESVLLLICYHFVLFTDIVTDRAVRQGLAWSMTACIGFLFLLNFGVIIGANVQVLHWKYHLLKLKKAMHERNKAEQLKIKIHLDAQEKAKQLLRHRQAQRARPSKAPVKTQVQDYSSRKEEAKLQSKPNQATSNLSNQQPQLKSTLPATTNLIQAKTKQIRASRSVQVAANPVVKQTQNIQKAQILDKRFQAPTAFQELVDRQNAIATQTQSKPQMQSQNSRSKTSLVHKEPKTQPRQLSQTRIADDMKITQAKFEKTQMSALDQLNKLKLDLNSVNKNYQI